MDFLEKYASNTRFIEAHRLAQYPPPRPGLPRRGTEVSVVLDLMIHDIDLVLTMVKSEIERFDVVGIPVLSKTEDIVNARIKFKNGSCASLTASPGESGADAPVPGCFRRTPTFRWTTESTSAWCSSATGSDSPPRT